MAWLSAASIRWLQGSSRRMASAVSACTGLYCSGLAAPLQGLRASHTAVLPTPCGSQHWSSHEISQARAGRRKLASSDRPAEASQLNPSR
ncbi:hypothetical protein CI102_14079 [Trichoderma harzianum]|nr:hypothetical protein CI102_14079 [Trichoderma harzianum]